METRKAALKQDLQRLRANLEVLDATELELDINTLRNDIQTSLLQSEDYYSPEQFAKDLQGLEACLNNAFEILPKPLLIDLYKPFINRLIIELEAIEARIRCHDATSVMQHKRYNQMYLSVERETLLGKALAWRIKANLSVPLTQ